MKMTGSNEDRIKFPDYDHALQWAVNNDWVEGKPNPNNKVITVFKCDVCGKYSWGSHTSKHCEECRIRIADEQTRQSRLRARKRKQEKKEKLRSVWDVSYGRIKYADMGNKFNISYQSLIKAEKVEQENVRLIKWNEEHTCPLADSYGRSVQCFYCERGLNYAGAQNLSERRCPNNPISPDGTRYIQRTKNRKDSNGTYSGKGIWSYDVADCMPQHLKVQLVERMRKMGRKLYLWSNGHLDVTPEPDSNNKLREVQSEKYTLITDGDSEA